MDDIPQPAPQMSIEDAVQVLLEDLPEPVRAFIVGPDRPRIALALSQKYGLHADQAGIFEHAFIFMLLGIYTPEQFAKELTDAGIAADVVRNLATDINAEVFIPLRNAEREGVPPTPPAAPAPQPIPATVPPVAPAPTPPTPQPIPTVPAASAYQLPSPATAAPTPAPAASIVPPVAPAVADTPTPVADPHAYVRTMREDMEMIHTMASRHVGRPAAQEPPRPAPAPAPVVAPPAAAAAPMPATPSVPPPPVMPAPQPGTQAAPTPHTPTPAELLAQEYTADPYREPIG